VEFDAGGKSWGSASIQQSAHDIPRLKFDFLRSAIGNSGPKVLEVGCSGGRHISALQAIWPDRTYVGCDIDTGSLGQGSRNHPQVRFVAVDGHHLPFADETFDAVYCMDYLEHVEDPVQASGEMARVLKKGGILSVFCPCEGNPWTLYRGFERVFGFNVKKPAAGHIQSYTSQQVIGLFTARGLKSTQVRFSYHLIGHAGDFFLFLLVYLNRRIADMWWSANKYYHEESGRPRSPVVRVFNYMLAGVNFVAYWESKLLHRVPFLSAGTHVRLQKS